MHHHGLCDMWPWMASHRFRPPTPPDPPNIPPWFKHIFGGGPPRAERGEVRFLILDALKDQPRHGYEVIQAIEGHTGGAYRPSPGTIYPTLQMLEELGQVRASEESGRKVYALTEEGKAELQSHADEVEEAYDRFQDSPFAVSPDDLHELGKRMHRLFRPIGKALRRGKLNAEKLKEIHQALVEAAERIEKALRG